MNGMPDIPASPPPPRWVQWTVAVFLVVLYLGTTPGKWWPTPDSAEYVGLAESLARGDGYRFNGEISTRQTPGLPLLLAGWIGCSVGELGSPGTWSSAFAPWAAWD